MHRGVIQHIIRRATGSNLRNRFILFFIVLATAPALILGGMSLFLIDLSHKQDVSTLELQLINQKIEEIEKFFANTLGILELRVGFTQKSEIELSQQEFLLSGLLEENRAFEEASLINLEGMERAKLIRGRKEGKLLDVSLLPKFQTPKNGENYIGNVYHTLSGAFVTLGAPVRNRNDEIIQVLTAEVSLSQLTRSIENTLLGTEGFLVLVDQDGALISQGSGGDVQEGIDLSENERVEHILAGGMLDGLGERDRYVSYFNGRDVVGAGKKIQSIGWGVFVEWPLSDADTVINDIRRQIIQLTLLSIFAVLLLAPLFANRLIRPIHKLQAGALEIEKGNFENKVDIKTDDELEELGVEFNKMAQGLKRLQELKDEFVFVAAHELKAPVTVIKGYISMIMERGAELPSKELKNFLSEIDRANKNLVKLVQDLLEVARSEVGRIEIAVQPVAISGIVQGVVDGFQVVAKEKKMTIVYEPDSALGKVQADPDKLKEVITNLISNAVKYTLEEGKVTITHEAQGDMLITHVADTGVGISPEDQKKLFTKFYRVKAEGTEKVSGTGLGLWIVQQLVQKMKGKIWVKSQEGKGSTFSFSLLKVS